MSESNGSLIQAVLATREDDINELLADYKSFKNLNEFDPLLRIYCIGNYGFVAIFFDDDENPLASVLNFEGVVIFTPYFPEENLMN